MPDCAFARDMDPVHARLLHAPQLLPLGLALRTTICGRGTRFGTKPRQLEPGSAAVAQVPHLQVPHAQGVHALFRLDHNGRATPAKHDLDDSCTQEQRAVEGGQLLPRLLVLRLRRCRKQRWLPRAEAPQRLHRAQNAVMLRLACCQEDGVVQDAVQRVEIFVASQHEQPLRSALEDLEGSSLLCRRSNSRLVAHLQLHAVLCFPRPPLVPAQVRLHLLHRDGRFRLHDRFCDMPCTQLLLIHAPEDHALEPSLVLNERKLLRPPIARDFQRVRLHLEAARDARAGGRV